MENLFLYDEENPEGVRAIMEAMIEVNFPDLK